jgi:hypothetical protein
MRPEAWDDLVAAGGRFTCYSSALAAWVAAGGGDWACAVDAGLHLVVTEEPAGRFGFAHLPASLAADLGLVRCAATDPEDALSGVRAALERDGRAIVAGDGHHLPWHVAHDRRHVPHWFTLVAADGGAEVVDPFECRTELGWQRPTRRTMTWAEVAGLLEGLPGDDPVLALREAFALGADARPLPPGRFAWLSAAPVDGPGRPPEGPSGPDAVRRLERHFREAGHEEAAYEQADDLWSIARHRAFAAARAPVLDPLAARWAHVAPLLMQARLSVTAGRAPSGSLPDTLGALAELEQAAVEQLSA